MFAYINTNTLIHMYPTPMRLQTHVTVNAFSPITASCTPQATDQAHFDAKARTEYKCCNCSITNSIPTNLIS